ncbi:dynamin family protein [Aspergillus alliaceus]|uniref:dynamin family protein n=1 Tax=Petromyces alliaceus TaxID=209559 RepID=UPI0012A411A4|nr:P-loop containing nucleoside triphosphate hydrolase protein [Aspergillus alliaceus]KAB8238110.1 P-loop containing nucleoside triphosphate hydrolase protein [Aspergillus alliaceus]
MKKHTSDTSMLAAPALLDKIDKLFACNVGEYIALPQLVVVGDQSSGKSSVLEGLTQLPFPRDSGLCTRFATQIIFRRNKVLPTRKVTATIIPAPDSDADRATRLKAWSSESMGGLEESLFSKVMQEVHEMMGVTGNSHQSTFSKDIFRLEICGPNEEHLSVIDVPGIFKNTTPGLTSKADIQVVRKMVEGYMRNPRSIMLTVIPANVDIATQEIMEMARDHDPNGERTIGVLTKPDLVDKGAENKVLQLVEGKTLFLKHGWTIVRNLSQQELLDGGINRDQREEIWRQKEPWSSVAPERFGIKSLKSRLQETITENARREFPSVRSEISKRLKESRRALESLGTERGTTEQQVGFLLEIINKFQDITSHALSTNYGVDDAFDDHEDLRLATLIVTRDTEFSNDLSRYGHEYQFDVHENRQGGSYTGDTTTNPSGRRESDESEIYARKTDSPEGLDCVLTEQTSESLPSSSDIYEWLTHLYNGSRGFEIGTFNVSLLATIMKRQSVKWSNLAKGYISDVIAIVHKFIRKVLEIISINERVFNNLLSVVMDDLLERYQRAIAQVDFLLHVELNQAPRTLNHYFNENLQKCRQRRLRSSLEAKAGLDRNNRQVVQLDDLSVSNHMSNTAYTIRDIHDILLSYYKVARKRFVDNILIQAADYHLVTGPEAPMKLFTPSFVQSLSKEQLQDIAGEDASTVRQRANLRKAIRELEDGRKILF